jgi:hypothetical protein
MTFSRSSPGCILAWPRVLLWIDHETLVLSSHSASLESNLAEFKIERTVLQFMEGCKNMLW